jgi:hypothetical protein
MPSPTIYTARPSSLPHDPPRQRHNQMSLHRCRAQRPPSQHLLPVPSQQRRPPTKPVRPVRGVRLVRPVRPVMKRHAFEIYYDQYDSLTRLAAEERMNGGVGSMSQMVREAIDRLIDLIDERKRGTR